MSIDTRLEALNTRIDALHAQRQQLKAQRERKRQRHESTADVDAKMQAKTLAQLRTELAAERRRYRVIKRLTGPGAPQRVAACRTKAKKISDRMKENA